ncbi:TRAP transporter substrate-binding protein [Balneolales bacterium ANBcel1]|nr:TRAP transporter substrate-binding protein [Balneolales bacterium ANBcel1]
MTRTRITGLALMLLLLLSTSCGTSDDTVVLRLGHGLDSSHPVHQGMEHMAQLVHEKSDGSMRINIYPNEQLGTERETLELLQIGSLDITKVSTSVMESFTSLYSIFSVPFLFQNNAHMHAVLDGEIGRRILDASRPYRIVGLCYYDAGTRSFYTTRRPIHTPDDLSGLSIRVQESASSIRMINTLGGSATPISWGELYTALQQGVVDGAENNPPSFYLSRHYEVSRYYTLNEHTALPDILLISEHTWEHVLNEEQRAIVSEAALESVPHQRRLWEEASRHALEAVEAAGVEIIRPDREPFMEASQPYYEHIRQNQPLIYELMTEIQVLGDEFID